MKICLPLFAVCFVLLCVPSAPCEEQASSLRCLVRRCCCPPRITGCPDDYCRKPLPCVQCLPQCGTCDNYCRKPMPCVQCLPQCGTCDNYCRKPLPCLCWPPSPGLRCVSTCPSSDKGSSGRAECKAR